MKKKSSSSSPLESQEFLTLEYMSRFHCICSECEDICCKDWKVAVDEAHYKMLNDSYVEKSIVIDMLDKIIVRVTYLFTKHIEHNKSLVEHIQKNLDESDIKKFVYLVLLLKY